MGLMTARQVAKELSIGYEAVLDLIHEGFLPHVEIPGRRSYRVRVEDVQTFIEGRISGSDFGSIDGRQPSKTGDNHVEPTKRKSTLKVVNADWRQRFRMK